MSFQLIQALFQGVVFFLHITEFVSPLGGVVDNKSQTVRYYYNYEKVAIGSKLEENKASLAA